MIVERDVIQARGKKDTQIEIKRYEIQFVFKLRHSQTATVVFTLHCSDPKKLCRGVSSLAPTVCTLQSIYGDLVWPFIAVRCWSLLPNRCSMLLSASKVIPWQSYCLCGFLSFLWLSHCCWSDRQQELTVWMNDINLDYCASTHSQATTYWPCMRPF